MHSVNSSDLDSLTHVSCVSFVLLEQPFGSPRSKRSPTLSSSPKESPRLTRVKKEKASTWSSAVPTSPRGQGPLASPRGQSPSPTASPRPRGQSKRGSRDKKEKKKKAKGEKKEAEESDDVITLLITTLSNCSAHGIHPKRVACCVLFDFLSTVGCDEHQERRGRCWARPRRCRSCSVACRRSAIGRRPSLPPPAC